MATKKAPIKKGVKPVQNEKSSVYFVSFTHGKTNELAYENHEIHFTDIDKIENITAIKGIESYLSKNFVNPKVINFVYLRKQK
jgi:hypothetical protein